MIRVLQCVNIMDRAGLETMLMNYYRNIDRTEVQFDFLTHRSDKGVYDEEIEKLGGRVYHAPRLYPQNYSLYFRWMREFFRYHTEYKIVHSHIDTMSYFPLAAAKKAGIPVRIAHSHSSQLDKDLKFPIKFFALKGIPVVANYYCACGNEAGKFMFGKQEFKIIRNAIDLGAFAFDEAVRHRKRQELGLENKFVIGHVGRYCHVKNQLFLLDVFRKVLNENKQSHLLLIGKGEDFVKIQKKINDFNIEKYVSLLVDRADVAELYQAMDVFVMPSLFEGLPVVGVEAQANGLQCIMSNDISNEIMMTSSIKMISLDAGLDVWKNEILAADTGRNGLAEKQLRDAGYDVLRESLELKKWYCSLI